MEASDQEDFEPVNLGLEDIHGILGRYDDCSRDNDTPTPTERHHRLFSQFQRAVQRGRVMFQQTQGSDVPEEVDTSGAQGGDHLEEDLRALREAKKDEASTFPRTKELLKESNPIQCHQLTCYKRTKSRRTT